ncbi:MAG: hypothetical protein IKY68_04665 [Alistipes sp.]|nr:hypothetical protein [Alistipes sp.]
MQLIIDQTVCDLASTEITLPRLDLSRLGEVDAHREGRTLRLDLPVTPTNDSLFGFARDPESAYRFHATTHAARLEAEGAVLFEGTALLEAASDAGYRVLLREGGTAWANQAALRLLHELEIDYRGSYAPQTILESWTNDVPVKFFPIHRDSYEQQVSGTDLLPAERLLTVDDYHPFLHLATLIEQIFCEAGYTLRSDFLSSEFFRKLYLSGAYSSHDTTAARNRMGFLARRLTTVSAEADYMGRVYADPAALYNTVGNLVESASPLAVDEDGEAVQELYTNGHCFTKEQGRILFRPLAEVDVGFEYYLKYVTEHRIRSRTELTGFDTLYIPGCGLINSKLTNRYEDQRHAIRNNHTYRALVFDHVAGNRYRILATIGGTTPTVLADFSERTTLLTTPTSGGLTVPRLQCYQAGRWEDSSLDWALYHGYIEEYGTTTVEMRLHSAAELVTPDDPKYFDTIFFGGAEEGMTLTLDKHCSVRPLFSSTPGYGSMIDFRSVARHSIRQIELLEAVAHLFNLRFMTDEKTRTVYVEPSDAMYDPAKEVDWRDRVVVDEPVTWMDCSNTLHEKQTWCYGAGEGAVSRLELELGSRLGAWSHRFDSVATLAGEKVFRNPLFHPSINSVGHYLNAPSASLLEVGDRDSMEDDGANFSPRLVLYEGLIDLPEGEQWGYPAFSTNYPLIAFHLPKMGQLQGFSLLFENRDGLHGLHSYFLNDLQALSEGGLVELTLRLAPHEVEALQRCEGEGANLRSIFRLRASCGEFRARLYAIERGNYVDGKVRCTFLRTDR